MQLSLPNRMQIFMSAIYVWAYILMQLNILGNLILKLVIIGIPNMMQPNFVPNIPLRVIKAVDENGFDVTNKLITFINFKWQDNCIDLDSFCEYIGSSIVLISYILTVDISDDVCDKFLNFVKSIESPDTQCVEKINIFELKKHIKTIMVNTSKKIIYKLKNDTVEKEDIIFGEIEFD